MNKSTSQFIYITIFMFCLLIPGVYSFISPANQMSQQEKRSLNRLPGIPLTRQEVSDFPAQFDAYYQDNFGFRSTFLSAYHSLKYWLKDSTGSNVIYGSEPDWLFYTNNQEDPIGDFRNSNQFTPENLEQFILNLSAKQQWLAEQGIEYLFILTPSKHYIYPEFLPKYIKRLEQINIKDQLADELKKHPEINFLDLTETIWQQRNHQLLYFKADTHWNYFAGNIAQYEIINQVNHLLDQSTSIRLWQTDEFKFQFNHQGDLAYLIKAGPQFAEPLMKPEFPECAEIDINQLLAPNSHYSTHCETNDLSILVYHDSFFNLLQPYISTHFGQVNYLKQRFNYKSAEAEINHSYPDLVIEQYLDRFLPTIYQP